MYIKCIARNRRVANDLEKSIVRKNLGGIELVKKFVYYEKKKRNSSGNIRKALK